MTVLIDAVDFTRGDIWKGAGRLLRRVSATVPAKVEDIMDPTTFVVASGFIDLGPTTTDGVSLNRTANLSDGIEVDQRRTALDKGEPESWEHSAECTLLKTTYGNLVVALQYGTVTALPAQAGRVAQHMVSIDAPSAFTEAQFAFVQQDVKSLKIRAWWLRSCVPAVDSELAIKSSEATGVPLKLTVNADEEVDEGSGQIGLYFEQD